MSIHHVECAATTSLPASTKLVLMAFADSADKDTRVAFPGLDNVMTWSGLRKSRALEVTAWLVDRGYLHRVSASKPGQRAEYLVFPGGCCVQHARLDGYGGPDPFDASGPSDPNPPDGSGRPDVNNSVDNSDGSGASDVFESAAADPFRGMGPIDRTNGSDFRPEWVRSGSDPSLIPPSVPPPPPTGRGGADACSNSPADGGGGGGIDDAHALLARLGSGWPLTSGQRQRLAPKVAAALVGGWTSQRLSEYLAANPDGVRAPAAVLDARLDDLPPASSEAGQAAPELPAWCGQCDGPAPARRFREHPDGMRRCPACHPAVARG